MKNIWLVFGLNTLLLVTLPPLVISRTELFQPLVLMFLAEIVLTICGCTHDIIKALKKDSK